MLQIYYKDLGLSKGLLCNIDNLPKIIFNRVHYGIYCLNMPYYKLILISYKHKILV